MKAQTFEFVCARITSESSCVLAVVYRSGSMATTQLFFAELSELLSRLAMFSEPFYVVGDFNVLLDRPTMLLVCI